MLNNTLKSLALSVVALLPLSASANNFNYNMLEVRLGTSPGTFGTEFNTYFTENTHIVLRADSEFSGDWDFVGGFGFNGPAGQFADVSGQMLIHNVKSSGSDKIGDEWGTEINLGTRLWVTQTVEAKAKIGKLMIDDKNKTVFSVGGRFHSTQQLSIGLDIKNDGVYGHQLAMAARFAF